MRSNVVVKVLLLYGLLMIFGVSLLSIGGIVSERQGYRDQVIAEVSRSTAGQQTLLGPMIVAGYDERIILPAKGNVSASEQISHNEVVLLPESLVITSSVQVEERHRGIHKAQVFRATNHLTGVFMVPARLGLDDSRQILRSNPTTMTFGVSDARGMRRPPVVVWNGRPAEVRPGSGQSWIQQGFSIEVDSVFGPNPKRIPFDIDLELVGTNQLTMIPVGASTRAVMESDWPHPSFTGGFLPDTRNVGPKKFHAEWQLSRFATGVAGEIERMRHKEDGDFKSESDFGVRFLEPVDVYQKADRAVKYGMLFVLLTFVAFFVFEVLRRMDVHPMQYLLAGSGIAIFFLLLISLSEHIPFVAAYLTASGACVALLSFYVAHVVRSPAHGLWFGLLLTVLYALLYIILESKDYALLLGTLLLFGVLALVMVLTRRVDWYRVGEKPPV